MLRGGAPENCYLTEKDRNGNVSNPDTLKFKCHVYLGFPAYGQVLLFFSSSFSSSRAGSWRAMRILNQAEVYFPPSEGIWTAIFHLSGKYSNHHIRLFTGKKTFVILFPEDVRGYRKEFELHGAREGVCKSKSVCISNLVVKALCKKEVKSRSRSYFEDNFTLFTLI